MRTLKSLQLAGFAFLLIVGMAYNAQALDLSPANATASGFVEPPSNTDVLAAADAICGCVGDSLYKQDVGGPEEGSLAGSYTTTFQGAAGDESGFTIVYNGGPTASDPVWLLVKDGAADPTFYLFDLTALGWDGEETIVGTGFWPKKGAVSHVEIFGETTTVPEPASLLMLGSGLVALGVARRRFKA